MKFGEFIADKAVSLVLTAVCYGMMLIFLFAYRNSTEEIITISLVYWIAAFLRIIAEYLRKSRFYKELFRSLDGLDRKYLVTEMIQRPDFYEGRLLYDAMLEADRSMCENVSEIQRNSKALREYIELWVHEIKLPVASLMLMCHNDSSGEKYLRQLKRVDDYIENVLFYSRSENAEKDYIIKKVPLKKAFTESALKNREELLLMGVQLETENLEAEVMTDEKWLEYIISQLFSNSLKYFDDEPNPTIKVSAVENESFTELHFYDNGAGIPECDIARIFDKTFTGENGRTHQKSTGMGLYIVKSLCGRLGASINVSSKRGEYTEFIIRFGRNDFFNVT